jgi:hypothetical protein
MPRNITQLLCLFCVPACLLADFSYEQTSKITGGALAGMMKFAGAFSKELREPMNSTIAIKGNQMLHSNRNRAQVIDLDRETITEIDLQKKTYSVATFADMKQALERMQGQTTQSGNVDFKVDLKDTGASKQISGLNTHQVIMTVEMQSTDPKTGNSGAMTMTSDMWLAPKVSGYDEVTGFYRRMFEKLNWAPGGSVMMGRADLAKAFAALYKEGAKVEGTPVLQVVTMGGRMDAQANTPTAPQTETKPSEPPPSTGEVAQGAAASSAAGRLGRLGGLAGGLGGFGRKKKQQEQPPDPRPAAAESQPERSAASGALMEMTIETRGFSSAPVDGSRFQVPAGFQKVENPALKH